MTEMLGCPAAADSPLRLQGELGMTATQPGSDGDELGPVDFLAIEFPGGRLTAAGFEQLLSLADQGIVDILDMEFITKGADGKSKKVDVWEFAVPDDVDLSACSRSSPTPRPPHHSRPTRMTGSPS